MTPERWSEVARICQAALELKRESRAAFLLEACGGDDALRLEVESLLAQESGMAGFLSAPRFDNGNDNSGISLVGRRLGSYVVQAALGSGGMGEVYRARDTKLGRDVAFKVLPRVFAADPQRLARFRREAQVLASLNHPHIGAIYGVEEAEGVPALVLELVEGDTLADRIDGISRSAPTYRGPVAGSGLLTKDARSRKPRRPLPLIDALTVARQVAQALEAAHERGIIHRDLKPANVKITPEGVVKVLDFGLAKITGGDASGPDVSQEPIVSGTGQGAILGTPAYMSPEQARGMVVDKRADIWSFGCVCYEMLAGRPAFAGETLADTLAAVVEREPDWRALPPTTPSVVRRLLERCLEKDPRRRLRDIGDARFDIEEALAAPAPAETVEPPSRARRWSSSVAWALAASTIAAVISVLGVPYLRGTRASDTRLVRFTIAPPANAVLPPNLQAGISALSPDGRRLAFVADRAGTRWLWIRSLDSLEVQLLPGTEGAESPFWSPDNQTVAFAAQGKLKAIDAAGGSVRILCDEPGDSYGGSWSPDGGTIMFATLQRGLSSVPSNGGSPTPLPSPDGEKHLYPTILPDGRHFIYLSVPSTVAWLGSLDSRDGSVRLLTANSQIQYVAPGYLLFVRRGTLMAQRFDPQRSAIVGEAVPIVEGVLAGNQTYGASFASSQNGVLVYRHDPLNVLAQLMWVDRSGRRLGSVGSPGRYRNPELSPDGATVVFEVLDSQSGSLDIERLELGRGVMTRLTTDPGNDAFPVWSPDGRWIMFGSDRDGGVPHLYRMNADGTGEARVLRSETAMFPQSWAPDGKLFVHQIRPAFNLGILPIEDGGPPRLFDPSKSYQGFGQVSPDGRWLLYASGTQANGGWDVYIESFPTPGLGKWKVSKDDGGASPRWGRNGNEIFYYARDSQLMTVPIAIRGSRLEVGTAVPLFRVSLLGGPLPVIPFKQQYDVASDGRFLLNVPVEDVSAQAFTVVVNWTNGVNRRDSDRIATH